MHLLGDGVRRERDQQGERVLQQRLLEAGAQPVDRHHQQQSDADAADRREQEVADPLGPGGALADGRGEGHAVGGDRGGVVRQGFALEDGGDPGGQPHPAGDRRGGDRVRRCHDGTQDQRGGRRQPGHDQIGGPADGHGGEEDVAHREQGHRPQLGAQIEVRAVGGRGVQQRGQQQRQDDVRVEGELGDARNGRTASPAATSSSGAGTGVQQQAAAIAALRPPATAGASRPWLSPAFVFPRGHPHTRRNLAIMKQCTHADALPHPEPPR
ncbi:hypothetical protein SGLAM104S_07359 [Streptomyces glaucescens]